MDAAALENALHAWAENALGVPTVWSSQNAPAPKPKPYATLRLVGPHSLGNTETDRRTNLAAPAGQEIEETIKEHQEWVLSVQTFADPATGAAAARSILALARMRGRIRSALDLLDASGVVLVEVGDTQDLSAVFGERFESRAVMDVRFRVVDQVTDHAGYIDQVGISSQLTGPFKAPK